MRTGRPPASLLRSLPRPRAQQPRTWISGATSRGCAGGASGSRSAGIDAAGEGNWYTKWRLPLAAAAAVPALGAFTYCVLYSPALGGAPEVSINIKPVNEEVFDTSDNLFVFFLDKAEELMGRQADIQRVLRELASEESLHRLRYYYNVRKEGDPPVPEGDEPLAEESSDAQPNLRCVMYKGQRKSILRVGKEVPRQEILDFFVLRSENLREDGKLLDVPRISGNSFQDDVTAASSPGRPVLLQMYEDTCFLCFLMRPFVNSLAQLFASQEVPLIIKRLNIEKNDFPDGCPVARGTPTFVLFRGADVAPEKWEEFKPKELVEKISKEFPAEAEKLFAQMEELQGFVSRRFQLFTQLVMWTVELQKLEKLTADATAAPLPGAAPAAEAVPVSAVADGGTARDVTEDASFNTVVSEMMAKDMRRVDGILDNLSYLQREVDEVEHDAALMGTMLAEAVRRRELAEQEQLRVVGV